MKALHAIRVGNPCSDWRNPVLRYSFSSPKLNSGSPKLLAWTGLANTPGFELTVQSLKLSNSQENRKS